MKTKLMVVMVLVLTASVCLANPLSPEININRVSAFPFEIELAFAYMYDIYYDSLDISGCHIYTTSGIAVIDSGIVVHFSDYDDIDYLTLDSSNTSGFAINNEGDSIAFDFEEHFEYIYCNPVKFGNLGIYSPPLLGHPSELAQWVYNHDDISLTDFLGFSFCNIDLGYTDIVINEINAHPTWNNGSGFIELYNTSEEPISLAGWQIVCDTIYDLPLTEIIPAQGYYVIDEADFPSAFDIDYEADNIYLISPDTIVEEHITISGPRLVDQVGWSTNHGENVSFMRYPDGDVSDGYSDFSGYNDESSTTFENGFPTRGAANRYESPGFTVIAARADSIDEAIARISWSNPIWDDQFDYAILIKKSGGYPETVSDGDVIYQGADQVFADESIVPGITAYYTIFAHNLSGEYSIPTDESRTSICFNGVGIEDEALPKNVNAMNCYPNPFNAQATIAFSLAKTDDVKIAIYDITGRLVETLVSSSYAAGEHSVIWNAQAYSSGVYLAKLQTIENSITQRLVLLK